MKELVVISGKGGTGKTSVMAAFASLAENMVLCDADVDAADLIILIGEMNRDDCIPADPCKADLDGDGDEDVVRKLFGDLTAAGLDVEEGTVRRMLDEKLVEARRQLMQPE